jgi:hypothetical protein
MMPTLERCAGCDHYRGNHTPACKVTGCDCGRFLQPFGGHVDGLPPAIRFDGSTYEPPLDADRLGAQAKAVFDLMADGRWRTLAEISEATGCPEASVSARLRDFRKDKFGGNEVERERLGAGLHRYRLVPARAEWAADA